MPLHQEELLLGEAGVGVYDAALFVAWPVTVVHVIDERSPLAKFSPNELPLARFEVGLMPVRAEALEEGD